GPGGGAGSVRRPAVQAGDRGDGGGGRGGDGGAVQRLPERWVGGPVPGAARPVDRPSGGVQALEPCGCVLARGRAPPAAAAHLRDRMGDRGGPGRVPAPAGGGRAAGPPQAGAPAGSVLVPGGARRGATRVASARRPL